MNRSILLILFLIGIFLFRIQQLGLEVDQSSDLQDLSSNLESFRQQLDDHSQQLLPQPQSALLSGMVLGIKSSLPQDFKKALQTTSTIHIVVVSGQNLTLLSGFILRLISILGRKKTLIINLVIVWFYILLTGFQVPIIRAGIMLLMASLAQFFNREGESGWILTLTALLMLIYNPNWLLSISFQLSFLATIGVVIVAPQIVKLLKILPEFIREDIGVSLAAQALTAPIIAANFHQFSLVGIFANALVLWTVSPIMLTGALAIALSFLSPILGVLLALIPGVFLTYFVYVINFFNQLPFSNSEVPDLHWSVWIGYYFLLAGIFFYFKLKNSEDKKLVPVKAGRA